MIPPAKGFGLLGKGRKDTQIGDMELNNVYLGLPSRGPYPKKHGITGRLGDRKNREVEMVVSKGWVSAVARKFEGEVYKEKAGGFPFDSALFITRKEGEGRFGKGPGVEFVRRSFLQRGWSLDARKS